LKTFFILSLPRTRTAWLANFLTYENSYCFHEGFLGCKSVSTLYKRFEATGKPIVGNSDCGNILFIDELRETFPLSKLVIVERPIGEVIDELHEIGMMNCDPEVLELAAQELAFVKRSMNALVVDYKDLDENACRHIWRYCIDTPFDETRWRMLDGMDIQIIPSKKQADIHKNEMSIESLLRRTH
jgi:hypothetical protein